MNLSALHAYLSKSRTLPVFFFMLIPLVFPSIAARPVGSWQPTSTNAAPSPRYGHTAVWTGRLVLVWGGYYPVDQFFNTGGEYNPLTDAWESIPTTGAPSGRLRHTAVWTGREMIVWGGEASGGGQTTNTGGRYNPRTNTWRPLSTLNAPSPREMHTAVWTGTEMIVWGGCSTVTCATRLADGASYNPATDTWSPIPAADGVPARAFHQAAWTGTQMLVWGGSEDARPFSFSPASGAWTAGSATSAPPPTYQGASVWTGREMIVWGGCLVFSLDPCTELTQSGARYNPETDTWRALPLTGAPEPRYTHSAVWTGKFMIVWGGCGLTCTNSGALYDTLRNRWRPMTTSGSPAARSNHRAVWAGGRMVVWGGCDVPGCGSANYFNSGGRYVISTSTAMLPSPLQLASWIFLPPFAISSCMPALSRRSTKKRIPPPT